MILPIFLFQSMSVPWIRFLRGGLNAFHGPFAPLSPTKHSSAFHENSLAMFDLKSYILNKTLRPWANKDELAGNRCFQSSTAAVLKPAACLDERRAGVHPTMHYAEVVMENGIWFSSPF